jgi:3-oxoacyl-[acyl-carrier-protein] synthase III
MALAPHPDERPAPMSVSAAEGRLRPGATVLLAAFGAGLVWGGTVATWRG